jgi:hypothetical protein
MPSPPKPWEAANANGNATSVSPAITSPSAAAGISAFGSDSTNPDIPARPQSLTTNRTAGKS